MKRLWTYLVQTVKLLQSETGVMALIAPEIVLIMKENNNLNVQTAIWKNEKPLTIRQLPFLAPYLRKTMILQNKGIKMKFENFQSISKQTKYPTDLDNSCII